jgi:aspartate/methionine/tyrosine aminotransferase
MGVYLALTATLNPGDEVLIFDPGFGPYLSMVGLVGGKPVLVPTREIDGRFRPDPAQVEAKIGPRTRVLLLNSPANPTGIVLAQAELAALGEVAERHDLLIVSDEVYDSIVFDSQQHQSVAALSPEFRKRTVVINSLSKTYAMTGWRVGYNVASADLLRAMREVMQLSGRCVPPFVQHGAVAALSGPQDCVAEMHAEYTRRRARLVDGLNAIPGLRCAAPEGTFYVFVDAREIDPDSWRLARSLLEGAGVVTTPGRHYGPTGEGYLRISFATSIEAIEAGLSRMATALPDLKVDS